MTKKLLINISILILDVLAGGVAMAQQCANGGQFGYSWMVLPPAPIPMVQV